MADTITLMRKRVLDMAIRGELVEHHDYEAPADEILLNILNKKAQLAKPTKETPDKYEKDTPFQIPKNWRWIKLGSVGITQTGNTPPTKNKEYYNGDIPFVKPDNIYKDHIEYDTSLKLTNLGLEKARSVYADSILMVCIGTIGKTFITDRLCAFNQQINSLTPYIEESYHTKFIFRVLESSFFQALAWDSSSATTISILNKSRWNDLLIPFPPLEEQKRIVAKVEEIFAVIDQIGTRKEDSLAIIENIRQTSLKNAIMGQLVEQNANDEPASELYEKIKNEKENLIKSGKIKKEKRLPEIEPEEIPFEIPENWKWVRLRNISNKIHYGYTASATETGDAKMLRITDIQKGKVDWDTVPFCEIKENKIEQYSLNNNDIVIARTGGTVGKSFIIRKGSIKSVFASYLIRIVLLKPDLANYVSSYLNSPYYWEQIGIQAQGTGQPNVNAKQLSSLIIPLPPLSEQGRIVEKLDDIMTFCNQMEVILNGSSEISESLKLI